MAEKCVKCGQQPKALVTFEAVLSTGAEGCRVTTSAEVTLCATCGGSMLGDVVKLAGVQADALAKQASR